MTDPLVAGRPARRPRIGAGEWLGLAVIGLIVFAAAGLGGALTARSVGSWYQALAKPVWTPPDAVFGPVWTALYAMMAIAAWRIWRRAGVRGAPGTLGAFAVQLALNVAWSALFFGLRRPGAALIEIAALWVAIAVTLALFARRDRLAAALLVPYWLWVTYAATLNAGIWWLNR